MSGVLGSLVSFVAAIALLVAVHEFGHFFVARRLGIGVLRYSVGFGKPLWSRMGRDGVEYVLGAVPIGGYVKMLDERDCEVAPRDLGRAFNRQPIWKRALVLLAGPFANLAFAVLIYWGMLVVGVPGVRPLLGEVAAGTPAAQAGLHGGDELVAVGGRLTPTWEAAGLALIDAVLADAGSVDVTARDEHGADRALRIALADRRGLTEPGALLPRLGLTPWSPRLDATLGEVVPTGPAGQAGLRPGDRIVAMDGRPVADWRDLVARIQRSPGAVVKLHVHRDARELDVPVAVASSEVDGRSIGRIEVRPKVPEGLFDRVRAVQRFGALEAVPQAVTRTTELAAVTLKMLSRMLTGGASLANISGPINIAQYAGVTAAIGIVAFLGFLAVISVSLGVLNLLPVPILDGGQLAFLLVEAAIGRPVPPRIELLGQQVGVVLLVGMMGLAFYNDIARLFG